MPSALYTVRQKVGGGAHGSNEDRLPKAEEALRKFWLNPKCPFSGHNEWTLVEDYVEVRPYFQGSLAVGGTVYPAVMVICNGCGYMAMFSGIRLGLLGTAAPTEEPKQAEAEQEESHGDSSD